MIRRDEINKLSFIFYRFVVCLLGASVLGSARLLQPYLQSVPACGCDQICVPHEYPLSGCRAITTLILDHHILIVLILV